MPGSPLNLDLPTIVDAPTVIVTKLIDALNVVKTDLEAKVIPSEIDWVSTMDARVQPLINVSYLHLSQGASTTAGSIYYLDGEMWMVTQAGAVKVTQGGLLNTGATGTVDYGGSATARITYNTLANEFRGTQDIGIWATWAGASFKIQGSGGGYINLTAAAAVTGPTSKVFTNPPAGQSYLVEDASGNVTPVTTIPFASTHSANITLSGGARIKHGNLTAPVSLFDFASSGSGTVAKSVSSIVLSGASAAFVHYQVPVPHGKRLVSALVRLNKSSTGITSFFIKTYDSAGVLASTPVSTTSIAAGHQSVPLTPASPLASTSLIRVIIEIQHAATQVDTLYHVEFTYDEV